MHKNTVSVIFFFIDEKFHEALKSPFLINYTEKETDCTESKMDQMVVEGHVQIMHEMDHIKDVHWNGSIWLIMAT